MITVGRGETKTINIHIKENGVDKDITDYKVMFTVKPADSEVSDDTDALIQKDVTSHVDPIAGKTIISLSKTDTLLPPRNYVYDIKLENPGGTWVKYKSLDVFKVVGVVTNR